MKVAQNTVKGCNPQSMGPQIKKRLSVSGECVNCSLSWTPMASRENSKSITSFTKPHPHFVEFKKNLTITQKWSIFSDLQVKLDTVGALLYWGDRNDTWYVEEACFVHQTLCYRYKTHTHTLSPSVYQGHPHTHTHTLIKHTLVTATFHLTRRHVVVGQVMMMRQAGILQNNQLGSESAESGCVLTGSVPRLGRSVPKKHDRCTSEEDINTHTRSNKAQLEQWRKKRADFWHPLLKVLLIALITYLEEYRRRRRCDVVKSSRTS